MNDDLISRGALLADLREKGFLPAIVQRAIERAPTVGSVEVVRCRECKYHNKPPCPMRLSFNWTEDDDFCSYGEREEGSDNVH